MSTEPSSARSDAEVDPLGTDPAATLRPPDSGVRPGSSYLAVLPGYQIGELIGRGGEGEVRAAVQRAFGRTVAVKTVRGEIDLERIKRFRAEAVVTALLEHPNIIPVYDLRGEGGHLQLVMKKIAGVTWKDLLNPRSDALRKRAAQISFDDHLDILLKVCDAIHFAHDRGFLHRDLKPENVMVGDHGEVLVMDWGCAAHRWAPTPHELIRPIADLDLISGSPAYMSPEQAAGEGLRQGPHSDVYLLAATLYELMTGTPPHRGRTVDMALRIARKGEIEDPRTRAAEGREVPEELAAVALAALHCDPTRRTQTVAAFSQAVRECRRHREALHLLADARSEAARAAGGDADADDGYRRAISACEQALRLWPGYGPAKRLYVEVSLSSADLALTAGAWRVCQRQAGSAAVAARELDLDDEYREAEQLAEEAQRCELKAAAHERHVSLLRRIIAVTGAAVLIGLISGMTIVYSAHQRTAVALESAQANLERFEQEQAQRIEREQIAAPALVAQARELAGSRQFDAAIVALDAAIGFSPALVEAGVLRGQCLAAAKRFTEAADEFTRCAGLSTTDPALQRLPGLCQRAASSADAKVLGELGDVFIQQGASAAAEALFSTGDGLDALFHRRVADAVPGLPADGFGRASDGTWWFRLTGGKPELTSLDFLRDIPLATFVVRDQPRLRDLGALAAMPLVTVDLRGCGVRDLVAVARPTLRWLDIARTPIADLAPLAGSSLETLDISESAVVSLAPLRGVPLKQLTANACVAIADLGPLKGMPLETLVMATANDQSGGAVSDLAALAGCPLKHLDVRGARALSDIGVLRGMPLEKLLLDETAVKSLTPLKGSRLKRLGLTQTAVTDLAALAGVPLEQLDFSPERVTNGLPTLRAMRTLSRINGTAVGDFWATAGVHDALVKRNPEYRWEAKLVSEATKVVEIEGRALGLRDLSPLTGHPLRRVWLPDNPVTTLDPLTAAPLEVINVSGSGVRSIAWASRLPLTKLLLSRTEVIDLEPLANRARLAVLHIDATGVVDLRPLMLLQLEELVFTPKNIRAGAERIRQMKTLRRLGTAADKLLPADEFWQAWDKGVYK